MNVTPAFTVDDLPVEEGAFYALACDPARSVVVEACAGAGKTWMLVARMLRALLDDASPSSILAITFTRKAAAEMRERLDALLRELALASPQQRIAQLRDRGVSAAHAESLAPQLESLYERVLASPHGVQIHTFHSWFAHLLRAAPINLLQTFDVGAGAELVEDTADWQPLLWTRLLQRLQADAALQDDFAAQVRLRGGSTTKQWLLSTLDKRVEIELADAADTLASSVPAGSASDPAQALLHPGWDAHLKDLAAELGRSRGKTAQERGALLGQACELADARARFGAAWHALFNDKGMLRKHLGDSETLHAAEQGLQDMRGAIAQFDAHAEHLRMVRLTRALLAEYAQLKRERGAVDMADLERLALALLRDSELAGWVQERLDTCIAHVLIDEFQDTSPLQWHAVHAWLSGYAGAGGGASGQSPPSVFIVGDPKQSIYRFRRAEPRVFDAAKQFVREALLGQVLACDHTRRNAPGVIDAVNATFASLQSAGGFAGFRAHSTASAADGCVLALPPIERANNGTDEAAADPTPWRDSLTTPRVDEQEALRDLEARQVAQAVAQRVAQGVPPGEIFVLGRKRVQLNAVAQALAVLGVRHVAPEAVPVKSSAVARDLIALLDVLASPHHDLALAQVLKSPVFGASDDDLMRIAAHHLAMRGQQTGAAGGSWWHALFDAAGPQSPALAHARDALPRWRAWAHALPPHDLLNSIVSEADLRLRYAASVPPTERDTVLDHIDGVLALTLQLDGARYATPHALASALRTRSVSLPMRAHPQAVQLLTVHGAKGLEARVVFIVDSAAAQKRAETATLLVDWPVQAGAPRVCAFVASEARCPSALAQLLEQEQTARAREELNALYVAMTRAKEQLVFSRVQPRAGDAALSWWGHVAPHGVATWAPPAPAQGTAVAGDEAVAAPALPRLPREPAPPAAVDAADDVRTAAIGTAVHRALEWLTRLDAARRTPQAVQRAAEAAARAAGVPADAKGAVLAALAAVLHSPDVAPLLDDAALAWAGNEVAIAWQGEWLRIDRLVAQRTDDGRHQWWVLDYKLQHAPQTLASYRDQLARYRDAVAAGRPGEPVRAAFITGEGALVALA